MRRKDFCKTIKALKKDWKSIGTFIIWARNNYSLTKRICQERRLQRKQRLKMRCMNFLLRSSVNKMNMMINLCMSTCQ